ncbi:MAG TPA: YlxM family DNA-binding protein [Bacillota bacterium]
MLEKLVRLALLYDFYGPLLTERQRQFIELYYQQDWSLGEIAAHFGVSRQAVHDLLRRAEAALEDYEGKLRLVERSREQRAAVERLAGTLEQAEQQLDAWLQGRDPRDLRRLRLRLRHGRRLLQRLRREV